MTDENDNTTDGDPVYSFESEYSNPDGDVNVTTPEDATLSLDSSASSEHVFGDWDPAETEFEGSFSLDIPTQTVVCPDCGRASELPGSPWLSVFTDEPQPCLYCGYPLL